MQEKEKDVPFPGQRELTQTETEAGPQTEGLQLMNVPVRGAWPRPSLKIKENLENEDVEE